MRHVVVVQRFDAFVEVFGVIADSDDVRFVVLFRVNVLWGEITVVGSRDAVVTSRLHRHRREKFFVEFDLSGLLSDGLHFVVVVGGLRGHGVCGMSDPFWWGIVVPHYTNERISVLSDDVILGIRTHVFLVILPGFVEFFEFSDVVVHHVGVFIAVVASLPDVSLVRL